MIDSYEEYLSKIEDRLEKRNKAYPIRNHTYYELYEEIENFTKYLIETNDFENWIPDHEILKITDNFYENPVFICGKMRSGTSLLSHLLDGHESLVVMPGDSHFVNRFFNSKNRNFFDLAIHWIQRMINPGGKKPFWFLGNEEKTLRDLLYYLSYFLKHSSKELFSLVVFSVFAANPKRSFNAKYWVEKTPHNELHTEKLLKKFPKAKFIHIIRNPLTNASSIKKMCSFRKNRDFNSWSTALHTKKLMNKAIENQKKLDSSRYHILRYEDLVSNPKKEMIKICNFLEIKFCELLCIPTTNGKPATSNTMFEDSRVVGRILDQSKSKRWESELTEKEKTEIVSVLYSEVIRFGYDEWKKNDIKRYRKVYYETLANFWRLTKPARTLLKFVKHHFKTPVSH